MSPQHLPSDVQAVLNELLGEARKILGRQFVGMYLYGSLAAGDFVPNRSDLDFAVITDHELPQSVVDSLEQMHMRLASSPTPLFKKLEGAYVPRSVIRAQGDSQLPVPSINEGSFYLAPLGADWAIQRHVIRESDVRLAGPSAKELIDPVPWDSIVQSILGVLENWWEPMLDDPAPLRRPGYQPFAVLSMCRAVYALREKRLSSKEQAARWAMDFHSDRWYFLISEALEWRDGDPVASIELTTRFMSAMIFAARFIVSGGLTTR